MSPCFRSVNGSRQALKEERHFFPNWPAHSTHFDVAMAETAFTSDRKPFACRWCAWSSSRDPAGLPMRSGEAVPLGAHGTKEAGMLPARACGS